MNFYFNHRRPLDFAVAILVAIAVYWQPFRTVSFFRWPVEPLFESTMLAVSASSATMVGFVLAASTFLITHTGHERFKILRSSAGYLQLLEIVRSSIWRLLLLTAFAGLAALTGPGYQHQALAVVAFQLTLSFCGIATLIWCTLSVLSVRI